LTHSKLLLAHRDLCTCPTRRSSELPAHLADGLQSGGGVHHHLGGQGIIPGGEFAAVEEGGVHPDARSAGQMKELHLARGGTKPRSEEHTSELQSRFDLVCRLLLVNN